MDEDAMLEIPASLAPAEASPQGAGACVPDDEPPIDLVHLARQTQGDSQLEAELLGLFRHQARALSAQLSDPAKSLEQKANIAHKLRGSALAVGAGRVARAAAAIEDSARARRGKPPAAISSAALITIEAAAAEAAAEIERLLG